jgi:amidase
MRAFAEYERYDATGLAELVRRREVTPAELVEAAIERIEASNPAVNAVVRKMFAEARSAAAAPLPDGPFAGVPFLLKDLMAAYAGVPLTSACQFLAGFVPAYDSELVARHKRAGLIVAGKTNTPELGIMGFTEPRLFGPCRNPWNTGHTPGGSSGGAAAAVAAGMVPMAHGGDGGGSLRIPASCCGLFGLKPTRGRNPLGPVYGESWCGLVQEHAITRTVRDSAALLDATCGPDLGAPYFAVPPARPFLQEVGADPGRLRIAFTAEPLFGESTHPDCHAAVEDAAALCASLGHHVEEARPRFDKSALRRAYLAVVAVNTARGIEHAGEVMKRRPTAAEFEPETWLLGVIGRRMSAASYQAAIELLHLSSRGIASFFKGHDIFLTPTLAHPPLAIGALALKPADAAAIAALRRVPLRALLDAVLAKMAAQAFEATSNTMLFNQTGQPAMSVPLFWSSAGLPIGSQMVARYGDEATLFRLASQLEHARPWASLRPPGSGLVS